MLKTIKWGTPLSLPVYSYEQDMSKKYLVVYYDKNNISLGEAVIYYDEEIEEYISKSDYNTLKQNKKITLKASPSWVSEYEIYSYTIEEIIGV
jgi:hypothetical protein